MSCTHASNERTKCNRHRMTYGSARRRRYMVHGLWRCVHTDCLRGVATICCASQLHHTTTSIPAHDSTPHSINILIITPDILSTIPSRSTTLHPIPTSPSLTTITASPAHFLHLGRWLAIPKPNQDNDSYIRPSWIDGRCYSEQVGDGATLK